MVCLLLFVIIDVKYSLKTFVTRLIVNKINYVNI